jgi:hypothetical protein
MTHAGEPDVSETIEVESIRRLDVKPGETLVITLPHHLSAQEMDELRVKIEDRLPDGVKALLTSPDVELTVVAAGPLTSDDEPMRA